MAKSVQISSEKLIALRDERGWTQGDLEAASGVSRSAIASYEGADGGVATVGLKAFNKLAAAFGREHAAFKTEMAPASHRGEHAPIPLTKAVQLSALAYAKAEELAENGEDVAAVITRLMTAEAERHKRHPARNRAAARKRVPG